MLPIGMSPMNPDSTGTRKLEPSQSLWDRTDPSSMDVQCLNSSTSPGRRASGQPLNFGTDPGDMAEHLAGRALKALELPSDGKALANLRKGDPRKVLVAVLLRKRTSVGNRWLAERLAMGHTAGVSRLVNGFQKAKRSGKHLAQLEQMLR